MSTYANPVARQIFDQLTMMNNTNGHAVVALANICHWMNRTIKLHVSEARRVAQLLMGRPSERPFSYEEYWVILNYVNTRRR